MKRCSDAAILTLRLRDRLGENGLVAVAIVKKSTAHWEIDNFLMSCRVIGRTVEYGLMRYIADMARRSGVRLLLASFVSGSRNRVAGEFLSRVGFTWEDTLGKWTLPVDDVEARSPICYAAIHLAA
jgi:FkbH-like protein